MREEVYIKGMMEYWNKGWFGLNNWKEKWGRKYITKRMMEYWKEGWLELNNWKENEGGSKKKEKVKKENERDRGWVRKGVY